MKFLFAGLMITLSVSAMAQEPIVKEISRHVQEIEVKVDETTVRCSALYKRALT
jgi:hypothetical protein